jgi:hypothetical protein
VDHLSRTDDALIGKLRSRAYDPAWRFDTVRLPREWVEERYGAEHAGRCRHRGYDPRSGARYLYYPAGAPEAVVYHRDSPREPPFPPATAAEVDKAERRLGYALPTILRRLYTEVADGGFGHSARGFASVRDGNRLPGGHSWKTCEQAMASHRVAGVPGTWHELTPAGCSLYWMVSLADPGTPVLFYDADLRERRDGGRPEDGVVHVVASLREWLWTWAQGGKVDDLVPLAAMLIEE